MQALTPRQVEQLVRDHAGITLWLVKGGFPCQPHSKLNAGRRGFADERALHKTLLREASIVAQAVPDAAVALLGECVASMDDSECEVISRDFGVRPLEICPAPRVPMRRPRYYWASWQIQLTEGLRLESTARADRVVLPPRTHPVPEECWADEGWTRASAEPLPTFVQSPPRQEPRRDPAGIKHCDSATLERWKADAYRFAPYQYKFQHGLVKGEQWRLANASKREVLMGFARGHTATVMSTAQARGREQELENRRLSLLGNSIKTGVLAWLFGWLLYEHGLLADPPTLALLELAEESDGEGSEAGVEFVRALIDRQTLRGREIRRLGPLGHPGMFPREAFISAWWKWRVVFGAPWKGEPEHI